GGVCGLVLVWAVGVCVCLAAPGRWGAGACGLCVLSSGREAGGEGQGGGKKNVGQKGGGAAAPAVVNDG
ncbi:MAG: hypothetical protein MPJ79_07440, partial [Alphaproteobacteria bacterium]|nr:hypothetical protein [Alphaproteobacteria bacterium]